jgi:pimeloyl-ACP methyl ester carboxylesterase
MGSLGGLVMGSRHSGSNPIGRFLKKITVPVLVMHGDDDQIAPYADSAPLSAKLLRNSTLKTYKGFPHGMPTTEAGTINADLLTFLKGASTTAAA